MPLAVIDHPSVSDPFWTTAILSRFTNEPLFIESFPWFNFGSFRLFERNFEGESATIIDYYYSCYALAFLCGFFLLRHWQRKGSYKVRPVHLYDQVLVLVLGMLIGAKLGYAIFYNPGYYLENPSELVTNWSGMASHGAMVGMVGALWLWARKMRVNIWHALDHIAMTVPFAGFFIRSANFANGELPGRSVDEDFPLAMRFPLRNGTGESLYESDDGQVLALKHYEGGKKLEQPYFVKTEATRDYEVLKQPLYRSFPNGSAEAEERVFATSIVEPGTSRATTPVQLKDEQGAPLVEGRDGDIYATYNSNEQREVDGKQVIFISTYVKPSDWEGEYELAMLPDRQAAPLGDPAQTRAEGTRPETIAASRLMTTPAHPSQLYQMFTTGVLLMVILLLLRKRLKRVGVLFGAFLMVYGLGRIATEFFRAQDPQLSEGVFQYVSMGQWLSLVIVGLGAAIVWRQRQKGALIADLPDAQQLRAEARARAGLPPLPADAEQAPQEGDASEATPKDEEADEKSGGD